MSFSCLAALARKRRVASRLSIRGSMLRRVVFTFDAFKTEEEEVVEGDPLNTQHAQYRPVQEFLET